MMLFLLKTILSSTIIVSSSIPIINLSFSETNKFDEHPFHQIYVLGDSLSDAGALMGAGTQFLSRNWEINADKLEFSQAYYNHKQFSTGLSAVQHLTQKLGLLMNPGWHFKVNGTFGGDYNQDGNNYAVGGSQAAYSDSFASTLVMDNFCLQSQYEALNYQHGKLNNNDLVVVESGNNDLFNALDLTNPDPYNYTDEQKAMADEAIKAEQNVIEELVSNNAKHILVSNVIDLSQTPKYAIQKSIIAGKLSNYYNQQWEAMFTQEQTKHSNLLKKLDLPTLFAAKIKEAKTLGMDTTHATVAADFSATGIISAIFENHGEIQVNYINYKTEKDLKTDLFLDYIHPTEWLQNEVGNEMYKLVSKW